MNNRLAFCLSLFILVGPATSYGQDRASSSRIEDRWGLLFDAGEILKLGGYEDGFQAGAGAKYWLDRNVAARFLAQIDYEKPSIENSPSLLVLGAGLAGEWHPKARAGATPYLGALAGVLMTSIGGDLNGWKAYLGGIFGVEAKLFGPVSFFGEYQLLASLDENEFEFTLGKNRYDDARALIGLIFYF